MEQESLYPALQVTGACNKRCESCLRPPDESGHRMRWVDFQGYLGDLQRLGEHRSIAYQFVTGGEPTLWRDGERDIVDVLAALSRSEHVDTIVMPTNGRLFEEQASAEDFVRRLSARLSRPVGVGISVADFQKNLVGGRCAPLDNLMRACASGGDQTKVVPVALVTVAVDDDPSEILSRQYPEVRQRVVPLAPLGWGAKALERCPALPIGGSNKESLGKFLPHFMRDAAVKLGISESEVEQMPNAELLNRMSFFNNCGKSPFVGGHWHYCLPLAEHASLSLGQVGQLKAESLSELLARRPVQSSIRAQGVVATAKRVARGLQGEALHAVSSLLRDEQRIPVAYRGCVMCAMLHERVDDATMCVALGATRQDEEVCL